MSKSKKSKRNSTSIWTYFIIAATILILAGLISYPLYQQYKRSEIEIYLNKTNSIIVQSNKEIGDLNSYFSQFKGDPLSAKAVLPRLEAAKKELNKTSDNIKKIETPAKAKPLQEKLIKYYKDSANMCGDLIKVADFIVERNDILIDLAKDTETFSSAVDNAKSDDEIVKAANDLKNSTNDALKKLESLEKPKILPYSNDALKVYISELSKALDDLKKAIEVKDMKSLLAAVSKIKAVFEQDWVKAQSEEDSKGLNEYKATINKLKKLRLSVINEQKKLKSELE